MQENSTTPAIQETRVDGRIQDRVKTLRERLIISNGVAILASEKQEVRIKLGVNFGNHLSHSDHTDKG